MSTQRQTIQYLVSGHISQHLHCGRRDVAAEVAFLFPLSTGHHRRPVVHTLLLPEVARETVTNIRPTWQDAGEEVMHGGHKHTDRTKTTGKGKFKIKRRLRAPPDVIGTARATNSRPQKPLKDTRIWSGLLLSSLLIIAIHTTTAMTTLGMQEELTFSVRSAEPFNVPIIFSSDLPRVIMKCFSHIHIGSSQENYFRKF